jgi:exopolyphosphatase / guanosine-5'-triphosphate,3'-diphosphate pyrophosphatase
MASVGPVAAIDCGTNSTRMFIVDPLGRPLERLMRITRLGEGVDETGTLSDEAIGRTMAVLKEYRQVMDTVDVVRSRLVATSAARDAANGDEFLRSAGEISGSKPELLTGAEEARLSMAGAVSDLDESQGPFLIVDIGGGSTELVVGTGPEDPNLAAISLQVGCVRMTERFLRSDPPSPSELADGESMVAELLDRAIADQPELSEGRQLVGLAGTVSTLASLQLGLDEYDHDRIHHAVLSLSDVTTWYHTLASEVRAARLDRAGMVRGREDVIVGGALILVQVMTRFGFEKCLVSEADILDGIVAGLLS